MTTSIDMTKFLFGQVSDLDGRAAGYLNKPEVQVFVQQAREKLGINPLEDDVDMSLVEQLPSMIEEFLGSKMTTYLPPPYAAELLGYEFTHKLIDLTLIWFRSLLLNYIVYERTISVTDIPPMREHLGKMLEALDEVKTVTKRREGRPKNVHFHEFVKAKLSEKWSDSEIADEYYEKYKKDVASKDEKKAIRNLMRQVGKIRRGL